MPGATENLGRSTCGNIHLLQQDASCCGTDVARFTLRVGNYQHVRLAYGEGEALAALEQQVHRINQILAGCGFAVARSDGQVSACLSSLRLIEEQASSRACQAWLWSLCAAMSSLPVDAGSATVFLLLSGDWELLPEEDRPDVSGAVDPWHNEGLLPDVLAGADGMWAQRYRSDMALAVEALATIAPGEVGWSGRSAQLLLLWQPVRDAQDADNILYYEALLRFVDRHGVRILPAPSLLALERLGLSCLLDHHIVSRVVAELEADPDVRLAVNISARSARINPWWHDIMARLRAAPSVARRLTIEITETAALPDMSGAVRFVQDMKRLGCSIALDDFGVGYASIRQLLALSPNIVKIDRCFLQRAATDDMGREVFSHLAGLAAALAQTVIVEGVETESQARLCNDMGLSWQQGYLWGQPSVSRIWRVSGDRSASLLAAVGESDVDPSWTPSSMPPPSHLTRAGISVIDGGLR